MYAKNMRGFIFVGILFLATNCYAKSTIHRYERQADNGGTQGGTLDEMIERTFGNSTNPANVPEVTPAPLQPEEIPAPPQSEEMPAPPQPGEIPASLQPAGIPAPPGVITAVDDEDCDCEEDEPPPELTTMPPDPTTMPPDPTTMPPEPTTMPPEPTTTPPEVTTNSSQPPGNLLVIIDYPPDSGKQRSEFSTDNGNDVVVMIEYPTGSEQNNIRFGQGEGRDLFVNITYPTESGTDAITNVQFSPESGKEPLTIRDDAPAREDPVIFIQFPEGSGLPPALIGNVPRDQEERGCVPRPLSVATVPTYDPGLYKVDGCRVKYDNSRPSYSLYNNILLFLDRIWMTPYNLLTSAINAVDRFFGYNPNS